MRDFLQSLSDSQLIDYVLCEETAKLSKHSLPKLKISVHYLAEGIIEFRPDYQTDCDIIISCGIHGNETAPIEICEQIVTDIMAGSIRLKARLLLILGNLPAMKSNQRFCEENLNRLFSGKFIQSDSAEASRAALIEQQVEHFYNRANVRRIHLDLHTAIRTSHYPKFAIYPYRADKKWDRALINWFADASIEAILLGHQPSGTFSYYTSNKFDADAFTVELGKARHFGTNDLSLLKSFKQRLIELLENKTIWRTESNNSDIIVFKVIKEVLRHNEQGFSLNLSDDFANFSVLPEGYSLTEDGEDSYTINGKNQSVVFPNAKVPVGQRVALLIEPDNH